MLHKAVHIHFEMNYRRLCENEKTQEEKDQPEGSSLIVEEKQINSTATEYTQSDYDAMCIQILNYVQVNLLQFFNQPNKTNQAPTGASDPNQC